MNLYCPSHKTSSDEYIKNYEKIKWSKDDPEENECDTTEGQEGKTRREGEEGEEIMGCGKKKRPKGK
jgi:hypothetical protein